MRGEWQKTARRWRRTLLGFAGVRGVAWLASTVLAHSAPAPEETTHREIAEPGTRYLRVAGHDVAYVEQGQGDPPILMLHGFGGRLQSWAGVQAALADAHRTVALDLWGFGASARPPHLTMADWPTQILGVMDALGIDSAVLAGHSIGGRAALMTAAQAPDRVRGLLLADPDYGHVPHGYLLAWGLAQGPVMPLALQRLIGAPAAFQRLLRFAYGPRHAVTEAVMAHYRAPLRVHGTARALTSLGRAWPDLGLGRLPARVACPTLVLWGEEDAVIPVEWAPVLTAKLPDATCVLLPGIGHTPPEECPEMVAAHFRRFLARFSPMSVDPR